MSAGGLTSGLFQAFLDYLYSSGNITVPTDYHSRCVYVKDMLDNDYSGLINTLLDYAINSATEAQYRIECSDETLEDILNKWLSRVNINVNGVPTGLQELAREYFKERWAGSSLCLLRVTNWEEIEIGQNKVLVPTVLWFVNGSSVYIKRENEIMYKLGTDVYALDSSMKTKLPTGKNEDILIQKPFDRWFAKYPVPYLIRKGVVKNFLGVREIQKKSDEVITKILPYLFVIEKGTENLFLNGQVEYDDKDLETLVGNFKDALERYRNEGAKVPTNAVPFDQKYQHLIPDLTKILNEELYRQGYRAILAGLGFVDVIQGVASTRKEAVLNPRPFLAEVNAGVSGFENMILDVVNLIIAKNKAKHRKFFSENNELYVVSSPLKINVEDLLEAIRSGFDRGVVSIQTYIEALGFDFETEKTRRQKELDNALEELFYPHLVQNLESTPDRMTIVPPKKEMQDKNEKENKSGPEKENFKNADISENLEIAPYSLTSYPKYLDKYPEHARKIWIDTWNNVFNKSKNEEKAFKIAWNALQKYMKKLKEKS